MTPRALPSDLLLAWVLGLSACAGMPSARADNDQDRARAAVQAGQVLPLHTLLERLERQNAGQVLKVELERESGHWIYEVKLLKPGGRLVKLELDAATGEPLPRRDARRTHTPQD